MFRLSVNIVELGAPLIGGAYLISTFYLCSHFMSVAIQSIPVNHSRSKMAKKINPEREIVLLRWATPGKKSACYCKLNRACYWIRPLCLSTALRTLLEKKRLETRLQPQGTKSKCPPWVMDYRRGGSPSNDICVLLPKKIGENPGEDFMGWGLQALLPFFDEAVELLNNTTLSWFRAKNLRKTHFFQVN